MTLLPVRPDGHLDYSRAIDPLAARPLAIQLAAPYAPRIGWWTMSQAIVLYEYVQDLRYLPDPIGIDSFVQPAATTLHVGAGNCEAKAVALVSMFRAVGIPSRVMFLSNGTTSHLLTQVFLGTYDLDGLPVELASYGAPAMLQHKYANVAGRQYFETLPDGARWLLVDPTISAFAGDLAMHVSMGLVTSTAAGVSWARAAYFSDGADCAEDDDLAAAYSVAELVPAARSTHLSHLPVHLHAGCPPATSPSA